MTQMMFLSVAFWPKPPTHLNPMLSTGQGAQRMSFSVTGLKRRFLFPVRSRVLITVRSISVVPNGTEKCFSDLPFSHQDEVTNVMQTARRTQLDDHILGTTSTLLEEITVLP